MLSTTLDECALLVFNSPDVVVMVESRMLFSAAETLADSEREYMLSSNGPSIGSEVKPWWEVGWTAPIAARAEV